MRHFNLLALSLIFLMLVTSCKNSNEDETYPNIITEMVDLYTNDQGVSEKFVTDAGVSFTITNVQEDLVPNAIYRILCGYVPSGESATIYQSQGVYYLRDSTEIAKTDPTGVKSAWRAGHYINMYLSPLTQGGIQYWGFITDSIKDGHAWVSLYHNQNADPLSYTQPTYASLPVDSIKGIREGDSITLHINTFNGPQTWDFKK
ncbi:MAG: hypothetical protein J6W52_07200 [Bacteroidaceae bacterium]|nr:hypothetical protein [Bacteroidaceae bacterium]